MKKHIAEGNPLDTLDCRLTPGKPVKRAPPADMQASGALDAKIRHWSSTEGAVRVASRVESFPTASR